MAELSYFDFMPQRPSWSKLAAYRKACRAQAAERIMAFLRGEDKGGAGQPGRPRGRQGEETKRGQLEDAAKGSEEQSKAAGAALRPTGSFHSASSQDSLETDLLEVMAAAAEPEATGDAGGEAAAK
eukprot:7001017-Alexandrium_andersonii.AAC.1